MRKNALISIVVLFAIFGLLNIGVCHAKVMDLEDDKGLEFTIIYDNYPSADGLETDWGFACRIKGLDKTILFDTGTEGPILLANMEKLEIDPATFDIVFITHMHNDHTGGLQRFTAFNKDFQLFVPAGFPDGWKRQVGKWGARVTSVGEKGGDRICGKMFSVGQMGTKPIEQSAYIETEKGIVVITGCAHPGIVDIVGKAKTLSGKQPYLVIGGFHLHSENEGAVLEIIGKLKELGVETIVPTHCTGDMAIATFKKAFGANCLAGGVGAVIKTEL